MISNLPLADRSQKPAPGNTGFDAATFTMQGAKERDAWMRIFPYPLPDTHVLRHRWEFEPTPNGKESPGRLVVWCEPKPELAQKPAAPGKAKEPPAANAEDRRRQLMAMADADLSTLAAELEVEGYRGNKAQRVAKIMAAEAARAEKQAQDLAETGAGAVAG